MGPVTRIGRGAFVVGVVGLVVGCAHTREEEVHTTMALPPEAPPPAQREVIAVDEAPPPREPAPVARPRLSQTVTLGQGTEPQYTPSPAAAPPTQPNVVVNNHDTVVLPSTYGGYGYGAYGYGPATGYGGWGRSSFRGDGRTGTTTGSPPQWGTTGWEGARRTAAPGQTPGVGGNWAPVPSYGPAQMK